MMPVRRLTRDDLPRLCQFLIEHWGGEEIVSRGKVYRPDHLEGFVVEDDNKWNGLLTFFIEHNECEVNSFDSLCEDQGLGTILLSWAVEEARTRDCKRIFLITTNDNLKALGFYQTRGFELVAIHRGAVSKSRKIKPSIPLIGLNNILLRDGIELEMIL